MILSVLKLDFVSPEDNFFDLGGDSFSALELSLLAGERGFLSHRRLFIKTLGLQTCLPI